MTDGERVVAVDPLAGPGEEPAKAEWVRSGARCVLPGATANRIAAEIRRWMYGEGRGLALDRWYVSLADYDVICEEMGLSRVATVTIWGVPLMCIPAKWMHFPADLVVAEMAWKEVGCAGLAQHDIASVTREIARGS